MQLKGKRHFIHEHPERSKSWNMPEVVEFLLRPDVDSTVIHMCAFGLMGHDEDGEAPVQKATRIMTSSDEVLKRVSVRCTNETCEKHKHHRHIQLIQGRAKAAQVYPRLFGIRICQGLRAQRRLEELGLRARPAMSVEQMESVAQNGEGSPSGDLHEVDPNEMTAFDDVSGQELDPALMMAARRDEIAYFRDMGVYEKVSANECWRETGKAPIGVRWVDINKGDTANPNYGRLP